MTFICIGKVSFLGGELLNFQGVVSFHFGKIHPLKFNGENGWLEDDPAFFWGAKGPVSFKECTWLVVPLVTVESAKKNLASKGPG